MQNKTQVEDLREESLIKKKWDFVRSNPSSFEKGILITGPNSFLGAHLVKILGDKWPGKIHLLIRSDSISKATEKMDIAFKSWDLGKFNLTNISIHLGDVNINRMGLKPANYDQIRKDTGFVLHMAMNPLYHLPYSYFKGLWLPELSRMINFCGDNNYPKSLHYPSSYNANFFTEEIDFQYLNTNAWQSGYAGFKWVANEIIGNALKQNLNGCLYDIPLVVGSEEKGICPSHYSIWHILDMFLKTGCFIDFKFKIIPIDLLAEIIALNLLNDQRDKGQHFLRPVLSEAVTDVQFSNTVAKIFGLRHTTPEKLREKCPSKHRFDFMFPLNFYSIMKKVNSLPSIWPKEFDKRSLPSTPMVFLSNLNRKLSKKEDLIKSQKNNC